ncbi:MAG: hypothetical protein ACI9XC_000223 [Gammaproteobacteria bacterium]|jgi:hypothetical protein
MKQKMVRESANQSSNDLSYLEKLDAYWNSSTGKEVEKLEAFTKYVSRQSLTKFLARNDLFKMQLGISGSVVEVGVHRGASLMAWAYFSSIYEPVNYLRKIIGFDTFEGFPSISKQDQQGASEHLKQGGFSLEEDALNDLEQAIGLYDINRLMEHISKVELIKGDATQTIPKYLDENPHLVVSLLHLDADLYEPTKVTLQQLLPRMPKGAVIAFDELNMKLFPGETLAVMEEVGLRNMKLERFTYATSLSYVVLD